MAFFKVMFAEGQICIWACMKFDRLFQLSAALKHKTAPWCRLLSAVLFCLPDITQVEVRCTWAGWVYKSARPDLLPLLLILCFCLFNMHTIIQTMHCWQTRHCSCSLLEIRPMRKMKNVQKIRQVLQKQQFTIQSFTFSGWNKLEINYNTRYRRSSGDEECIIVRFHRAECIE